MAHFAKLNENNIVLEVAVVNNDALDSENEEASGIAFLTEWSGGHTNWKQTSYNRTFRKRFAGAGWSYDPVADEFVEIQPFPSWLLNDKNEWEAPIPKPTPEPEGKLFYYWVEEDLNWQVIPTE
jgi:hypothetical protein